MSVYVLDNAGLFGCGEISGGRNDKCSTSAQQVNIELGEELQTL